MKALILTLLCAGCSLPLQAEVLWQDVSVTYLNGSNYRVDGPDKQVLTFEHAAGTSWGDSFFFFDHLRADNGKRSNYAEWSPRLSLGKLSNAELKYGIVKDLLFTSTVEMSSLQTNFLYGVATDLTVPGFNYFKLNFYRRNNDGVADNWQLTTTWAIPFSLGELPTPLSGDQWPVFRRVRWGGNRVASAVRPGAAGRSGSKLSAI